MRSEGPPIQIDALLQEVFTSALEKLSPEDQQTMERMIEKLSANLTSFGRVSALDTLGRIALFIEGNQIPRSERDLKGLFKSENPNTKPQG